MSLLLAALLFVQQPDASQLVRSRWFDVAVEGERAYFARTNDLTIVDLTIPARPDEIESIDLRSRPEDLVVEDGVVYIAGGSRGLVAIELAPLDPDDRDRELPPELLFRHDTPGRANAVAVHAGHVYLADGREGIRVIDRSRPGTPRERGRLSARGAQQTLEIVGETLWSAGDADGLRLWSLEHPDRPLRIAENRDLDRVRALSTAGDSVWLAMGRDGVALLDRADRSLRPRWRDTSTAASGVLAIDERRVAVFRRRAIELFERDGSSVRSLQLLELPRGYHPVRGARIGEHLVVACLEAGYVVVGLGEQLTLDYPPTDRELNIRFER